MFEFFDTFLEVVSIIIDFIVNFFSGLIYFIKMLVESSVYLTMCLGYLPTFLSVFASAIIAMSIIMMILNHGG